MKGGQGVRGKPTFSYRELGVGDFRLCGEYLPFCGDPASSCFAMYIRLQEMNGYQFRSPMIGARDLDLFLAILPDPPRVLMSDKVGCRGPAGCSKWIRGAESPYNFASPAARISTTQRMQSPECISLNAVFMPVSGCRWVMNSSTFNLPSR